MPSAKFEELYPKVGAIKTGPSNDEALNLYAWAKIAKGEDISGKSRPGVFSMKERAKYDAWKRYVDEGLSAQEAEKKYIELGEQMIAKYGS